MIITPSTKRYAARHKQSGKFIEHVSGTGRVSFRKNPLLANFFNRREHAEKWLACQRVDHGQYEVIEFERVITP
jgi:hypothetical protein